MKIGIIADTHDNLPKIKEAVDILNQYGVGLVLHAGDYVAPFSVKPLLALHCPFKGVFGNNDGEKKGLAEVSSGAIVPGPLFLELGSKKVALTHEFNSFEADIIVYAHTHVAEIKEEANKIIINPGEVCGWLYGRSSLALLDLESVKAEIIYF